MCFLNCLGGKFYRGTQSMVGFSLTQYQILWINIINCIVDSKEVCQWDLWREMINLWKYLIQTTWIRRELEIIMTGKMTSVCYVQTWHPLFRLGDHCNIFHMWYLLIGWWRDYDSKRELAKVSSTLTIFKFLAGKEQRKPESLSSANELGTKDHRKQGS